MKVKAQDDDEDRAVESKLLAEERRPPPKTKLEKIRREGGKVLHSKHVLITVVILNLLDCILVLGELILDIHYVKDVLEISDRSSQRFMDQMEGKYPHILTGNDIDHLDRFYEFIYQADCTWRRSPSSGRRRRCTENEASFVYSNTTISEIDTIDKAKRAHAHSIWEVVAHGMHKASIAILSILFLENLAKIFCAGLDFLSNKLEVFDAFIVLVSFTLDIVFLKGLTVYRIQDGIFILSFLVPWRVVRVVNSLIVAVLDHEHFRLKVLYMKNKKLSQELDQLKENEQTFNAHMEKVEKFMEKEGIPKWKIAQHTHFKRQSTIASMASLAMNGILCGLLEKNVSDASLVTLEIKQNGAIKPEQNGVNNTEQDVTITLDGREDLNDRFP